MTRGTGRNRGSSGQRAVAQAANGAMHGGSKRAKGQGPRAGYDDKRYRAMRGILKATGTNICWICHHPIDTQLPYPHPLSWSCDHLIPRSHLTPTDPRHWHITNAREAHLRCNEARGNHTQPIQQSPLDTSIEW